MVFTLRRAAVACALGLLAAGSATAAVSAVTAVAAASTSAQHRVLGTTTLSQFKVEVTATRAPMDLATVTATGYQHTSAGWKPIATKTIGTPNQWFWYSVEVCSLTTTEFKTSSSGMTVDSDTMRLSLLATPAIGCTKTYTESWKP